MTGNADAKYPVPVIAGPTASGKTAVAVELALLLDGEIISADSMQVYRYLSLGTAKPTPDELCGIPYHLIDHVNPDEQYHLGRFVSEAQKCMVDIRERGKLPIICGGTGLYIRGLLYGVFAGGEPSPEVRACLEFRLQDEGLSALFEELQLVDPISAERYSQNDRQRILRALEVYHDTGKPLSSYHQQDYKTPLFPVQTFVLSRPRPVLYDRINRRVDEMITHGLIDEVQTYLESGWNRDNPAIMALGYRDIIEALEKNLSLEQAVEAMKQKSRNFAKRQETWFRSMANTLWVECDNDSAAQIAQRILSSLEKMTR